MHELPGSAPVARTLAAAAMLAASIAAQGAELDLAPDAVLGKPTFTTAAGGAASAANLIGPGQAAEDPVEGTLWVVDTAAHRVLRFGSAAAFANGEAANLVLGQPDFTSSAANRGGLPAANALSAPVGIAVDQAGRVYVAEDGNHRILVFRPPYANGMEAFAVIGQADFASASANRGGTKGGNTLAHPRQLAVNDVGDLFVADSGNDRVLRFTAPAVTGAAASRMIEASGHGTAPAAGAALSAPQGVAIGASGGDIWVADTGNNRVIRFPGLVAGPATIVLCQPDFAGVAAGTGAGACSSPASVAVDLTGVVYVGDSQNSRVLRFATPAVGAFATGVMGQPDFASSACNAGAGVAASTLCNPAGVAVNRDGHVLVVDGGNARVLRHDLPGPRAEPGMSEISPAAMPVGGGAFTLTVNGLRFHGGSAVHWNGVALATRYLSGQRLVAQVPAGHIASAGPHSVTVVTPGPGGGASPSKQLATYARSALDNAADRVLGQYDFGPVWSPASQWLGEERLGSANAAQISGKPVHAAIDPHSGRLFVASLLEARVLSWPSAAAFHNGQAADVILGTPDEFTTGPGPRPADLCGPVGLAVGGGGVLFVSDSACNRILAWSPPFVTGMAPSRVFGQGGSFTSILPNNGGISADSLATPLGLAATGTALIVHDSGNARLLVYDDPMADTTADTVIGQAGMDSGALAPPGATRISAGGGGGAVPGSQQGGLALDRMGRIYFADGAANRIIRFSPPFSNGMAADLVIGQQDFLSSTAGTTGTTLDGPVGIALDPAGSLLVADQSNHRVLRFAAPLQTGMAATGVLGQPDFSSRLVGSGPASLNGPTGLAADRLGNIFVVDAGERLLAFDRPFALPAVRGDADDDRKADLFWRESSGGLSWWTMNGATATAANYHDVDPAWQIADVGDLDGDGKADLVWRRASDGASYLWLLDGFAFKGFADLGVLDPASWTLVGTADLDGNGKDDIVWRGADGTVYAWLMNGGVITSQGVISNPGTVWVIADLADMNGDGRSDIVFRNTTDGGVYIFLMNGLSIAAGGYVGAVDPAAWTLAGAADFNGDGKADFLWRHTSGDTWVWLMDGASFVSAGGIGNPGASWSVRSLGDFDGDGKADLLWRHTDGTTYLWRMNGLSVSAFEPIANPGGTWEVVAP